jgi:N-methylhydantoinase A/oxoprolinase/acetone carboxylase beta subunit
MRAQADLRAEGAAPEAIRHELWADMRYRGQAYEIEIRLGRQFVDDFHRLHQQTFGYATPDAPVEVVNLRLRAYSAAPKIKPARLKGSTRRPVAIGRAQTIVGGTARMVPIYPREALGAATRLNGPLIVTELSTTAYVAPEFALRVDDYGNLHLERR